MFELKESCVNKTKLNSKYTLHRAFIKFTSLRSMQRSKAQQLSRRFPQYILAY